MIFLFDDFELDESRHELRRAGRPIALERRIFNLIAYLVRNADRVVTKKEIFQRIWNDRVVAEGSLTVAMSAVRRALGDDRTKQEFIRTHPGVGYRFIKSVTSIDQDSSRFVAQGPAHFVGRTTHLRAYVDILDGDSGESSILLLSGEPGIGKSRLLGEYKHIASSRGIPFSLVRCPETERTPYLWPCQQIIRNLAVGREDSLPGLLPLHQSRFLAGLFPDLFPGESAPFSPDPDAARFQLFESLSVLLRELCNGGRQILALDDFHRLDDGTARFLAFAASELRDSPLVLIATYRPLEAAHAATPAAAIQALLHQPNTIYLTVEGFDVKETLEMATSLAGTAIGEALALDIHAQTGGNPFFIRQIIPLLQKGAVATGWPRSPTLTQAIAARIAILSENTRSLLKAAAVFGREFDVRVLETSSPAFEIGQGLQEAAEAGLVLLSREDDKRGSFVHVFVRDALYSELLSSERSQLHLQIGKALDSDGVELSEQRASEVARHYLDSADNTALLRAVELGSKAGRAASRRSAHEDATHHYSVALKALARLDERDQARECHLLLSLGGAHCRAGNRGAAKEIFREAAVLAKALGASEDLARAALGVAPGILAAEAGVSDASLEQLLADALQSLGASSFDLRALLASRLAMAIQWSERHKTMQELMDIAKACLARSQDPHVRLHVLFAEWFCGWNADEMDQRHAIAEQIQSIADLVHDREMSAVGMVLRMLSMLEHGDIGRFDSSFVAFDGLSKFLRQPQLLWYASMYRGMRSLIDGRLDDAEMHQKDLSSIAARLDDANAFHTLATQRSLLQWERGNLDPILGTLVEGVNRYPTLRGFRAGLAWALLNTGRIPEASRHFEILAACSFGDFPQRYDWPVAVAFAAEVCAGLNDHERAAVLYQMLQPYQGRAMVVGLGVAQLGAADRLLGLLSGTLGQIERAEWHFERAIEMTDCVMPAWSGQTKLDLARLILRNRRTGHHRARELAGEALCTARSLCMSRLERCAEEILNHS